MKMFRVLMLFNLLSLMMAGAPPLAPAHWVNYKLHIASKWYIPTILRVAAGIQLLQLPQDPDKDEVFERER